MCFSASASFTAAALLAIIGSACLYKANARTRYLATVPLLFALQQASEGCIWLALAHNYMLLAQIMTAIFLFFAFFLWPTLLPYALYAIETEPVRKKILSYMRFIGCIVGSILYGYTWLVGASAHIINCHIYYAIDMSNSTSMLSTLAYLICTVGAGFVASDHAVQLFALLTLCAYAISCYAYYTHFISVWCFFAALLSASIYWIITRDNTKSI